MMETTSQAVNTLPGVQARSGTAGRTQPGGNTQQHHSPARQNEE